MGKHWVPPSIEQINTNTHTVTYSSLAVKARSPLFGLMQSVTCMTKVNKSWATGGAQLANRRPGRHWDCGCHNEYLKQSVL